MTSRRAQQQQRQPPPPPQPPRRTIWQMYKGIEPRYRILLGMGFMGFSMFGLWASDKLEEIFPAPRDARVTHISHRDLTPSSDDDPSAKQPKQ